MSSKPSSRKIRTTETTFDIIELLKREGPMGVTAIADRVGLTKSTVHGHLSTLAGRGYIVKDDGEYRLGLEFLDVGMTVRRSMPICEVAESKMQRLADETGERTQLMTEQDGLGYYVLRAEGGRAVPTDSKIGKPRHLHTCSSGKALLAFMDEATVDHIIDRRGLPKRTPNTITDRGTLEQRLGAIRDRGYAYNRSESVSDLWAIGAPITDPSGEVLASLSISGPAHRMKESDRFREELPNKLLATIEDIELNLTYS